MVLVIPGVEVRVVKDVVSPQLSPSGVLGITGLTEKAPAGTQAVQSWSRFVELYGAASAYSMPDAVQALQNGVSQLVVSPVDPTTAKTASVAVPAAKGTSFTLSARAPGSWANGLVIMIAGRTALGNAVLDITISSGNTVLESLPGLPQDGADKAIAARSTLVVASAIGSPPKLGDDPLKLVLAGGADAAQAAYAAALRLLESEPDVDMVLAAVQDFSNASTVAAIYGDVIAHCARMSANTKGRIGFGEVAPYDPAGNTPKDWAEGAAQLLSERFVLLAPNGVAGAVAGMVGSLEYFQSPTFKTVAGLTELSRKLLVEEQETLLKANVVPVATMRGRGTVVVRGLTTDGDQISVRRVADRAVRGVKMIGDLFIGRLNNESQRGALREKLVEFLVQMEKDGAIVPSTDRRDPAFKVNVYSSQDDFVKGIVRVDMAVRPVRAIDYIYATVLVQT
ncbi:MAG: phage tail sheath subtilisin-like domain-containing protein [Paracraurococcus sp.]|jgi:hypothetical protein